MASASDALTAIDPWQVWLGGEMGRRIDLTVEGNLLQLDLDRDFLAPFMGGSDKGVAEEARDFIGVGKTLDGMVRLAAHTGNEALLERKNHVVQALLDAQEEDGYIGLFAPEKRTWTLWDLHEQAFIIEGLLQEARLYGNEAALNGARRLGDYIIARWPGKPADWESGPVSKFVEEIGLDHAFISLHEATAEERYLNFAWAELGVRNFDLGIVLGRFPPIEGHSYAYLSHCLAQLDYYRLRPDSDLLRATRRAVDFMTQKDGMLITGGVGQVRVLDGGPGRERGHGRDLLDGVPDVRLRDFAADAGAFALGRHDRADDLQRRLCGGVRRTGGCCDYYAPFTGKRVYFPRDTYCCPGEFPAADRLFAAAHLLPRGEWHRDQPL